jgi:RimJ/RimL family protein N-acetyltransferase
MCRLISPEKTTSGRRCFGCSARSTDETVLAAFRRWDVDWAQGNERRAAREASSGHLVGGCAIQPTATASPAVVLDLRPFSYARRVVTLATRFAFDRLDIARMEIYVEIDNRASNAVAASAGFVREGVLRSQSTVAGRRRDMALYARLAGGHGEVR